MKKTILFLMLITTACSSVKIKGVQKADDFSITNYKTFSFYEVSTEGDAIGPNSQANLKLLKEAITKELDQKGVKMVADNPDLHVNIGIVVMQQVQTVETSITNPSDRTYYMGNRNYSWQSTEKAVGTYRDGSVIVHLVDQATNKLVWQGVAESVLPEKEKNVPALIQEAIKSLFAKVQ
jgi:hypothetical protein